MNDIPERRINLSEFYKNVIVCHLCLKPYGSDIKVDNNTCPECVSKIRAKNPQAPENRKKGIKLTQSKGGAT